MFKRKIMTNSIRTPHQKIMK